MERWRNMESVYYIQMYIIAVLAVELTGYCLYGDGPGCALPCHCAVGSECTTDCLPTGCATDPLNITWHGPGCQIGNVALGKTANQTGGYGVWIAPKGVDGQLPNSSGIEAAAAVCAHPTVIQGQQAEWGVDLDGVYKISSVIIYNRPDKCCRNRTTMFTIGIRNSSNYEELCYDDNSTSQPNYKISITCNKPVIGRYIRFARKQGGYKSHVMNFCEFIAIGHPYFDCSVIACVSGSPCHEVTGCEQCTGSYPPDCLTPCEAGFYGVNCQSTCGHCAGDDVCHVTNGHCPNDCTIWWAGQECTQYIVVPEYHNETTSVTEVGSSFLHLAWQPVLIPLQLSKHYGYTVFYKQPDETNYTQRPDVSHTSSPQATIPGLTYNTEYHIEIRPYRQMMGTKEYGSPYPLMIQTTTCGGEGGPDLTVIISTSVAAGFIALTVIVTTVLILKHRRQQNDNAARSDGQLALNTRDAAPVTTDLTDVMPLADTDYEIVGDTGQQNTAKNNGQDNLSVKPPDTGKDKSHGGTDNAARSDRQLSLNNQDLAPVTTDLTDVVPLEEADYENMEVNSGHQNAWEDNGQDNVAVQLNDAGYTKLTK